MEKQKQKLTSVRVDLKAYQEFKIICVKKGFTFQKLVERSLHLYLTDKDFANKIDEQFKINLK